ncbi:MMPL family transporter [bacterium]|nr:MMPL family transporter [bacterium]
MMSTLRVLIRYPILVLAFTLAITGWLTVEMIDNARLETDLDEYMPQDHPAFIYSDQAEVWFDIKDGILVAIEHPDGIYNTGTLTKVRQLTKDLQKMEEIEKDDVTSLYTAENIAGSEDGLDVRAFYSKAPRDSVELAALRDAVRGNEMVQGRLVSDDETVTLIVARIGDDVFSQEFYDRLQELTATYEGPEEVHIAGSPIVEGTLARLAPKDMQRMVPIVVAVILIVLFLLLRSVRYSIITLLIVLISSIWTFGLMGLLGIPIYSVTTMLPVILIAIGVADGIHLYNHLRHVQQRDGHADRRSVVMEMLHGMWKPVVITSLTTSVGFISLLTSDVLPVKYFGVFTAFGVLSAMVLSLVFLPATLLVFGVSQRPIKRRVKQERVRNAERHRPFGYRFADLVLNQRSLTLTLTAAIVAGSIWGMTRLWIDSSFLEKFEKDSDIVQTDAFINRHFGGTSTLNVILEADSAGVFKQPEVLREMARLQDSVLARPKVGSALSLVDYLKRINMVLNEDRQEYYRVPETRDLTAQFLLLYEMSGDPDNLWQVVNYDYNRANLAFQLKSDNARTLNDAISAVEPFADAFERHGITINYAGSGYKAMVFADLILEGQIKSLVLSIGLIVLLLALMFRNLLVGVIGAIPITVTALISFGLMGALHIPLTTTTALIASIAIGIGVDYAVHFVERYRIAVRDEKDARAASRRAMQHTGRAILFNALVVIAGFLVLLSSVFPPNRALGAFVSLNMATSFLGTVTVLLIALAASKAFLPKPKHDKHN